MDEWQDSLDRMETALAAASKTLERSEERWELAVAPSAGEGEPPLALNSLDTRLGEWETRLQAADALRAVVEQELTNRTANVERWRGLFAHWEEVLKRGMEASPPS